MRLAGTFEAPLLYMIFESRLKAGMRVSGQTRATPPEPRGCIAVGSLESIVNPKTRNYRRWYWMNASLMV